MASFNGEWSYMVGESFKEVGEKLPPDKEIQNLLYLINCYEHETASNEFQIQQLLQERYEWSFEKQQMAEENHRLQQMVKVQQASIDHLIIMSKKHHRAQQYEDDFSRQSLDLAIRQVAALSIEVATSKIQVKFLTDRLHEAKSEIQPYKAQQIEMRKLIEEEKAEKRQITIELNRMKQIDANELKEKQFMREKLMSSRGNDSK